MLAPKEGLPYGDGASKIFGMENFGNTCYCNSILQCLYYTEKFRKHLLLHNQTKHEPKLAVSGVKPHGFSSKYEQLMQKKLKEQSNPPISNTEERPKSSRKGSLFGIKFNSSPNTPAAAVEETNTFIVKAGACAALPLEQRILIGESAEFSNLYVMITRPIVAQTTRQSNTSISSDTNDTSSSASASANNSGNNNPTAPNMDYWQSSSMLLSEQPSQSTQEGTINPKSSAIIVGIPKPETYLNQPINPFNANPNADQRKRSALINGPIINLDTSLQLPSEQSDDTALLYALKDLFESMVENQSTIGVVSPNYFITKLKDKNYLFRQNNMHHDAHEFFNYLINEIIESVNKESQSSSNWCNDIFQGLITNETKCLSCETVTSRQENFLDLSIDIPPGESAYSLNYSINNFSKSETLRNQNKFHCNTCSSLQEAVKTIKIKKSPQVLVINLKRFKYDEKIDKLVKLFDSISYPFKLRLFNTTDDCHDNILYELYALVIHIGGGPMHGHYVSICKIKAGLWLLFDDETVELVEDNYVMRFFGNGPGLASAYILFYQKIEFDERAEYFGFDPSTMFNGENFEFPANNNAASTPSEEENLKTNPFTVGDVETKSDISSINSFTAAEPKKPPMSSGGMFRSFKLEKEDKSSQNVSRTSSDGSSTINQEAVNTFKEPKEKKSWIGNLKRTNLERKLSSRGPVTIIESVEDESEPNQKQKQNQKQNQNQPLPPPPLEKRRSLFGFKKKN
ncbi:uncharacterized protein LODBEIA_P45780 [Lodderomyces beijingensis]|uniref:Ubiquitin carboxyl-terminal hydrolase n=1 Tax=Lodderomyces beijingensis TaxID=1775926 RepID=A0ABP0ZR16_9ASCO